MGVGKSAFGRRAARELGLRFIDSDHQIEKEQGKKIMANSNAKTSFTVENYNRFINKVL